MNQKEATYNTVVKSLHNAGVNFTDGDNAKALLTSQVKATVRNILFDEFRNFTIDINEDFKNNKLNNDSELKKYVAGLLSNWLRKDIRLNGGLEYKTKNPGSRAGSSDPQIREVRKLLKKVKGTPAEIKVQQFLREKLEMVKASKNANSINVDIIPESLRELV